MPLHLLRQDCPVPRGTPCVAYCRDSGHEAQDRSVAQQLEGIHAYIDAHGLVLIAPPFVDEAKQSTNTAKRDALQDMLAYLDTARPLIDDIRKRERKAAASPFAVVFYASSRLARDEDMTEYRIRELALRAIATIDLTAQSTGVPLADGILRMIKAKVDAEWVAELSRGAKRGLAQLVSLRDTDADFLRHNPGWQSTGRYVGIHPGVPPRGFRGEMITVGTNPRTGQPRIVQRIVADVGGEWERARLAWELRRAGAGFKKIHDTVKLYKTFAAYSTFFSNPIYTGTLHYGGAVYVDFVPALIPVQWYEDEQAARAARGEKLKGKAIGDLEPRRQGTGAYLLTGLVQCRQTSDVHPMHGHSSGGGAKAWRHYQCSVAYRTRGKDCDCKPISAARIDKAVIDYLMNEALTESNLRAAAAEINVHLHDTRKLDYERLSALKAQQQSNDDAREKLVDAIEAAGMSATLKTRLEAREAEHLQLAAQIRALESTLAESARAAQVTDADIVEWGRRARIMLEEGGTEAIEVVRAYIQAVYVDNQEVVIVPTFTDPRSNYAQRTVTLQARFTNARYKRTRKHALRRVKP